MADDRHVGNRKISISQRKIIWFWWHLVQMQNWNSVTARWPNMKIF